MARYEKGVRFDHPTGNDGFVSHVARRGAEKTATGVMWFVVLMVVVAVVGAISSGSVVVIVVFAVVGIGMALAKASSSPAAPRYRATCPGCSNVLMAPASPRVICPKCSYAMSVKPATAPPAGS
jgi:ribosomal protein S27AE